jgi:hypothetical protein
MDEHDLVRDALQVARPDERLEVRRLHAPEERQGPHDLGIRVSHAGLSSRLSRNWN